VPTDKISKLCNAIRTIPPFWRCSVRAVASVVGQVIIMGCAIGPVARLCTWALYRIINKRWSWSSQVMLSEEAREELQFGNSICIPSMVSSFHFPQELLMCFFLMPVLLVKVAMWLS